MSTIDRIQEAKEQREREARLTKQSLQALISYMDNARRSAAALHLSAPDFVFSQKDGERICSLLMENAKELNLVADSSLTFPKVEQYGGLRWHSMSICGITLKWSSPVYAFPPSVTGIKS